MDEGAEVQKVEAGAKHHKWVVILGVLLLAEIIYLIVKSGGSSVASSATTDTTTTTTTTTTDTGTPPASAPAANATPATPASPLPAPPATIDSLFNNGQAQTPISTTGPMSMSKNNASASGIITGAPGSTVTVNMNAGGSGTYSYTLTVGNTTKSLNNTNQSASFAVVIPASGNIAWNGTFVSTDTSSSGTFTLS